MFLRLGRLFKKSQNFSGIFGPQAIQDELSSKRFCTGLSQRVFQIYGRHDADLDV